MSQRCSVTLGQLGNVDYSFYHADFFACENLQFIR